MVITQHFPAVKLCYPWWENWNSHL